MTAIDQFLVDVSLRAGIVLVVATCLSLGLLLCRGSAAVRHWVWSLGLGGALAVPVFMALVPGLSISMPWPERTAAETALNSAARGVVIDDDDLLAWVAPLEASLPATIAESAVLASEPMAAPGVEPSPATRLPWLLLV